MQNLTISTLERFVRLASKAEPSIQGSGGSDARFNVIQAGAVGLNLTDGEVIQGLTESGWLARCLPPWPMADIQRSIPRIRRDSRRAPGYLLADDDHRPRTASNATSKPAAAPSAPRPYTAEELARKLTERAEWNNDPSLSGKQEGALSYLRDCPKAPSEILNQNGLVKSATYYDGGDKAHHECYVLTDRAFRQYRKFDGTPFSDGVKSRNKKGSLAKGFFCAYRQFQNLEPDDLIFIVEGAIGLLECVSIQWLSASHARRWRFLAAHSSSSRFFYEPQLLKSIAGHHVRILPDPGKAGTDAARAWRDEFRSVGCPVDFATLPDGFQDLGKLLAAGSDGIPAIRSILAYPTSNRKGGAA